MAYTTIDDPSAYFKVQLYTGTGSENVITFNDTDTDMQPDMVWTKSRSNVLNHNLYDSVRGVNKGAKPNTSDAEFDEAQTLKSFNSDGFTVGTDGHINTSSATFASWSWKESATAGFDIVTYTGNGTDDTDISHNLSAVPHLIIVKNRDEADAWQVYHHKNTSAPETDYLVLNEQDATADNADRWSDEAPTSSVFTLGDGAEVNTDTEDYIAYCFAEKQGYSKFGSYTGNGDADGPFVYTGFKPAFLIVKATADPDKWQMTDHPRDADVSPNFARVVANDSSAERTNTTWAKIEKFSNGFKLGGTDGVTNGSGETYIYIAFAEAPFVNSNGVPCNAR